MNRQVTIAGGGLAGLALGIVLRGRGVPAQVIEASSYPRHRVCGEFISGIREDEIAALGISDLLESAARHRSTAWFDGGREMFRRDLPDLALGISRHFLDDAMARRFVERGGELKTSTRAELDDEGIVWACGRRKQSSEWLGLKAHYTDLALGADLEIHLASGGYIGLTRVEGGHVNVCGLFRRTEAITRKEGSDSALEIAADEAGLPAVRERLRGARIVPGSLKGVNQFALGWQSVTDGRVAIGDAAAMIPPFTGNGMTMALQSALVAAGPAQAWSEGRIAWRDAATRIRAAQAAQFDRRLRWARALQGVLMHPAGRLCATWLMRSGCIAFESLYRRVR